MYFSGLKKSIQSLEEKKFYDIALLFLTFEGYKDLSIIDGSGDGGRDVICSRTDLRIQLSVRKDWDEKINYEAAATLQKSPRHFLYITNRNISEKQKADFFANKYKYSGEIEVTIIELNRLATALAQPGRIKKAYETLGQIVNDKVSATPKEIALSNVLLLSSEAKDLRENVIESNIKAAIYKKPNITEEEVIKEIYKSIPGINDSRIITGTISRLSSRGEIISQNSKLQLSETQTQALSAAETEFLQSIQNDLNKICTTYGIDEHSAKSLINLALEIDARNSAKEGDGIQAVELADLIGSLGLNRKKLQLFEDLSGLAVARVTKYGSTIDHIFSTNTFDIYRSLGKNSNISMILDSSVAMPMLFGLSFRSAKSRYGIGAAALSTLCQEHGISIFVPRAYLNEMAYHGLKAIEYIDTYNSLGEDGKSILKSSGNAYLSHYSHIRDHIRNQNKLSLQEFLHYFGVSQNRKSFKIENHIETLLDQQGIQIIDTGRWDPKVRTQLRAEKPHDEPIIIDHDASVCTFLRDNIDNGYIFATWDKKIIDYVEGLARIFAQTPSGVVDFLSMAGGAEYDPEQSFSILTSLIYCDESKASALAQKIERIKSAESIFELNKFSEELRNRNDRENVTSEDIISSFFKKDT